MSLLRVGRSMKPSLAVLALLPLLWACPRPSPSPTPTPAPTPEVPAGAYDCSRTQTTGVVAVREPIENQWIVVLKGGVGAASLSARSAQSFDREIPQLEDVRPFKHTPGFTVRIPHSSGVTVNAVAADALTKLSTDPRVQFIQQDGRKSIPKPPLMMNTEPEQSTWGLDRVDQRDLPLSGTYEPGGDGNGVHAFEIDTGIKNDPAEFGTRLSPEGFSAHPGGTVDAEGHGTHVAGTIGSKTWGVAKLVTLHAVRVLDASGSGSDSDVIRGVDWVTDWKLAHPTEPAVANSSLGGGASPALDQAYCNSIAAGVTHVFAAGNETEDAKNSSPARVLQGITVGATWRDDTASYFSNFGPILDVWAPGSGITSLMLGGGSTVMSGTSMASPHVTGAAALYLQRHPLAKPDEVVEGLKTQATDGKVTEEGAGSTRRMLYVREN